MKIHSMLSRSMASVGIILGVLSHSTLLYSSTWTTPVPISQPGFLPSTLGGPVLVVNSLGNAITVWTTEDSPGDLGNHAISSAYFTPSTGWLPAQFISDLSQDPFGNPFYSDQGDPDIVMNSSNYAVAAWEGVYNNAPFPSVVIYATRSSDGTWNPAQILFAGANFDQPVNINLALNEAGTTVAAWRLQTSTGENTQVSFLPFGGSWSTPLMISTAEDGGSGDNKPFPAINENGNVVVSWQSKIVNDFGIGVATYNAATNTWSPPLILDSTPGDNVSENPRSAIDANGNAIVAWRKDTTIYASYFDGTSWGPPVDLSSVLGPTEPALDPDVVMDAQGNATVLWSTNGLNEQVFSSSRLPNGTWTTPVAISGGPFDSFSSFMSQNPLSVANNGDMMSIWGSNDTIFADYRPFGSQWLPFEIVASGSNIYLNIGLTSCGLGIAVWLETEVVASMNYNMLLPQNARAKKCCDKFTVQKRCLNILKWDPSPCAKYFNIYRDGVLIDSVSPSESDKFIDLLGCKNKSHNYTISLVNFNGFESDQVPVVFH